MSWVWENVDVGVGNMYIDYVGMGSMGFICFFWELLGFLSVLGHEQPNNPTINHPKTHPPTYPATQSF